MPWRMTHTPHEMEATNDRANDAGMLERMDDNYSTAVPAATPAGDGIHQLETTGGDERSGDAELPWRMTHTPPQMEATNDRANDAGMLSRMDATSSTAAPASTPAGQWIDRNIVRHATRVVI